MAPPATPACRLALPCEFLIPGFHDAVNRAQVYICDGPVRPSGAQLVAGAASIGCTAGTLQDLARQGPEAVPTDLQAQGQTGAEVIISDEFAPVKASYGSAGDLLDDNLYVTTLSSSTAGVVSGLAVNPGADAHQAAAAEQSQQAQQQVSGGSDVFVLDEAAAADSGTNSVNALNIDLPDASTVSSDAASSWDVDYYGVQAHQAAATKQPQQAQQQVSAGSDVFVLDEAAAADSGTNAVDVLGVD